MFPAAAELNILTGPMFYSSLPLWLTLLPMLAGIGIYLLKDHWENARKACSLVVSFLVLIGVTALFPYSLEGAVNYDLIDFMQMGLFFEVDLVGWVFSFLIALVWFLATLFSFAYMDFEHKRRRYYSFLIFTLGATLGVVMAGDFFTLFLFFELMTISSFVLVIHEQDMESMKAGVLYLYLGIFGGLALLFAIMMLFSATGSVDIVPSFELLGGQRIAIFIFFLIGFGIKAGIVPLHIWLPEAHPVAPSPASALLSGIMIKTGAYGILRVSINLFAPTDGLTVPTGDFMFILGNVVMWIGIVTMLAGATMALLQTNMKRILAYSSVSQMGYIITGVGCAAFLSLEGGMGYTGAIYHVINHAFFKAGLFMMVGTIYIYTHELELPRLGGMFKKMPLVGVTFLVAAFGIAGIPGFNGFPSKTLVHDAMLIAIKDYGFMSVVVAEKIFVLTSALTICYFTKLFRGVFLGPVPEKLDREYKLPFSVNAVLSTFALIIIAIGIFPNQILERILVPAAERLGYEGYAMDHLYHFNFFEWMPLEAMLIVIVLAIVIYVPAAYRGWFDWKPPWWLSVHAIIYRPFTYRLLDFTCRAGVLVDSSVDSAYDRSGKAARTWCNYVGNVDSGLDRFYEKSSKAARKLADKSTDMDSKLDQFYEKSGEAARKMADRSTDMDSALNKAYEKTGRAAKKLADQTSDAERKLDGVYDQAGKKAREQVEKRFSEKKDKKGRFDPKKWSTKNLSFDTLLLVLVLGIVLLVIFYFGRSL